MNLIIKILSQIPEIKNYDDIGLKSFLIFVIISMGLVIWHLWNRVNLLSDKISELQTKFSETIMDVHEKTLTMLPSFEKSMLDSNINMSEKVVYKITTEHDKTRNEIKENTR